MSEAPVLTRELIFARASDPLPVEQVVVPEWGGAVYVRSLTAKERDEFEASCTKFDGKDGKPRPQLANYRGRLAARVLCDSKGSRLFSDDDAAQLGDMAASALDRVVDAARKLNGMAAESIEEAKGN